MYHSVTFGDKNTWDDWHLVPTSRPVFNPPTPKIKTLDIPGGDGAIDLTESLTGYPVYNNRTGSMEFIVVNSNYYQVSTHEEWYKTYSKIMDHLHGKSMKAVLEDDKEYYYEGRFSVNNWKSDKQYSKIVIDYSVGPYKWKERTSLEDWLWDPFNFETGIIPTNVFKNIPLTTSWATKEFDADLFGSAPVCPTLVVSTSNGMGAMVKMINLRTYDTVSTFHVPDGRKQIPEFVIKGDRIRIQYRTYSTNANVTGTLSIDFRQGGL